MDTRTVLKQVALSLFARRKKWIVLTTLAALVLLVPVAYILSKEPPRYRTTATILIETRSGDRTPVFQEFSPGRPLPVQLAILQSRLLAASVVETLSKAAVDDLIHNPYGRDYVGDLMDWVGRWRGKEPTTQTPQRRAVGELRRDRVRFVSQSGSSGIVEIQAEASQPQIALDIANTYIEVLLARTRSFNVDDAKSTREYLSQQTAQVSDALSRSETALRSFTLSRGGVQIPAKSTETAQRLSQLETTLAEVLANRNISQTRLTSLKAKLESMPAAQAPAKAVAAAPVVNPANAGRLRAKLSSLEAQMVEAKTRYNDEHPRLRSLAQQITEVQRELGDAVKESTVSSSVAAAIPAEDRNAFAEMVAALDTSVVSLSAQENAIREQIAAVRRDLTGLSKDELEYRRLASDVETNRKLSTLLSDKLGAARIREQGEMNVVKVIDPPGFPSTAPNQRRMQFVGLALALALVIGLGAPATAEYFNRPIMGETDVKHLTGLPILTAVPEVKSQKVVFGASESQPGSQEDYHLFVDSFRRLRVELQMMGDEMPLRKILVASCLPFEGKSTVVFNLGLAFGEVGKRVIIADADFHRPTLHRIANASSRKGFTDLLAGTTNLVDTITPITENVHLAPRGGALTAPARTGLGTDRLARVLGNMSDEADYVLMDSSPILLIPDNLYMAAAADGIVLVVAVGQTRPRDLVRTKAILERAGTPIVGVVLNRTPVKQLNSYYKQYSGYYGA